MSKRKARRDAPAGRQWEVRDLLAKLEAAGCTEITTRAGLIYFRDVQGERCAFPYACADARGTDYLVAGPGTGEKLTGAYEHGTAIMGEYTLCRLIGLERHPLHEF